MTPIRFPPVPSDTLCAFEAAFGKDHPYLKIGDGLNLVLSDVVPDALDFMDTNFANSFWLYSLATILQYWEDLTDRQMANATRARVDLKYALHLPLIFPGISPLALCKFRQQLLQSRAGRAAFQQMVDRLEDLIGGKKKLLANSDGIIATICMVSRWEMVIGRMNNAIEALAAANPEWLRTIALPHWYQRYYRQAANTFPRSPEKFRASLLSIGEDGRYLLKAVAKAEDLSLMKLPEVRSLLQGWQTQFSKENDRLRLRSQDCSNCDNRALPLLGFTGKEV